jgi:hypothetical protein
MPVTPKEAENHRTSSKEPNGDQEAGRAPDPPVRRRLKKYARWLAAVLGLLVGGAVVLVGFALLALQSERVSTSLVRFVAGVLSSQELQLEVERAKGSWVRSLSASGITVVFSPEGADGGWVVAVDTVSFSYRLRPLLRRTVWVEDVGVAGVTARVRLEEGEPEETKEPRPGREPDAPWLPGGWEVRVGSLGFHAAKVEVWEGEGWLEEGVGQPPDLPAWRVGPEGPEEPWTATDVRLRVRDLELGAALEMILEALEGSFRPPGIPDEEPEEWGRVAASGRVGSGRVLVDSLLLESPESRLRVMGTFPLDLGGLAPGGLDLSLAAEPLHMRDLGPLLPTLVSDSIRLWADGDARTTDGVLRVELEAGQPGGRAPGTAGRGGG